VNFLGFTQATVPPSTVGTVEEAALGLAFLGVVGLSRCVRSGNLGLQQPEKRQPGQDSLTSAPISQPAGRAGPGLSSWWTLQGGSCG
jgi:hypothetical protein